MSQDRCADYGCDWPRKRMISIVEGDFPKDDEIDVSEGIIFQAYERRWTVDKFELSIGGAEMCACWRRSVLGATLKISR